MMPRLLDSPSAALRPDSRQGPRRCCSVGPSGPPTRSSTPWPGTYRLVDDGRHVGHPKMYNGLVGTAKVIWRQEGVRGMYRGLGPIILGYLPTWAVWFTIYNKSKGWLARNTAENRHMISFWSSIIAGASSTIPHARGRPSLRLALSKDEEHTAGDALVALPLDYGRGEEDFPTYEFLKMSFTGHGMGAVPAQGEKAHWLGILSASILSKILASSATYPHEVIRTRLQTQRRPLAGEHYLQGLGVSTPASGGGTSGGDGPKYKGIVMTFRTILREEGWRAFYAGLGTNMMRAVPAATVTMLTYEYVMRQLNSAKVEGRAALGVT
ncbi:hypothetical protein XA68_10314 [Ophiocordyceps unilateralis]|uniref:Mitochondrial carrier protein n=1 Tax=Ophiocordyceps unilateralis TaxID=268505 RepID=A0A2A9PIU0_OPHUN|nr:hypothetical protein XA68_10314 [Ophiocordyceps unilateralis]